MDAIGYLAELSHSYSYSYSYLNCCLGVSSELDEIVGDFVGPSSADFGAVELSSADFAFAFVGYASASENFEYVVVVADTIGIVDVDDIVAAGTAVVADIVVVDGDDDAFLALGY